MRSADGVLRRLATVHLRQPPVVVTPVAVMEPTDVKKPSQQSGDNPQGIRFEVL